MRSVFGIGFVLLVGVALVACGTDPRADPTIDFSEKGLPLTQPQDMLADGIGPVDGVLTEVSGDSDGDSENLDLAGDTGEPPEQVCQPKIAFCKAGLLMICNEDGTDDVILNNCSDDNKCTDDDCVNSFCVHTPVVTSCCFPSCAIGELCINSECVCTPNCYNKQCGDDGCGGSCGECPDGGMCSLGGKCNCSPDCTDLECGDDGCGGSCGYCIEPAVCTEGTCVCTPDCTGKICGDDGCGGSCGSCPVLHKCDGATCIYNCPTCPEIDGCTAKPYDGHVYYFCSQNIKWKEAQDFCVAHQSSLVIVKSAEENQFLADHGSGQTRWIGLFQEWWGEWKWVNGDGKGWDNWDDGQPDDGGFGSFEDCGEIKHSGFWNDQECGDKRPFICEFVPQ